MNLNEALKVYLIREDCYFDDSWYIPQVTLALEDVDWGYNTFDHPPAQELVHKIEYVGRNGRTELRVDYFELLNDLLEIASKEES